MNKTAKSDVIMFSVHNEVLHILSNYRDGLAFGAMVNRIQEVYLSNYLFKTFKITWLNQNIRIYIATYGHEPSI